jgi:hypothetical protein
MRGGFLRHSVAKVPRKHRLRKGCFSACSARIASYSSAYEGLAESGLNTEVRALLAAVRVLGGAVKITEKARADVTAKPFAIEKYDQMNSEVLRRIAEMSRLG